MSALAKIQERILDTNAMIARLEHVVSQAPAAHPSMLANIRSLVRMKEQLEHQFEEVASEEEVDLYHYRILPQATERLTISAVADAWKSFQSLFSVVYDSMKNGPKKSGKMGLTEIAETSFGFGYAYAGSLGVVLTMPNERLLFNDTMLRRATVKAFDLANARTSDEVAAFARDLGAPPIRALYKWVDAHVSHGLGVAIDWRHETQSKAELLAQYSDLARLKDAIALTSDSTVTEIKVEGRLTKADVTARRFKLEVAGGDIEGAFGDAISEAHAARVPWKYSALIRKTTQIKYSMEEEQITYFLIRLVDL